MRLLIAFGVGAATMYLLDPERGRKRRALLRDKLVHARRAVRQAKPDKPLQTPEGAQHLGR